MDAEPSVVRSDLPLRAAIDQLLDSRHGCLLVVRDDKLVGIVTERDLLRAARARLHE
jgi:CBS domain-containing protein